MHASRTTAAHSTVTLADRSSASFVSKPIAERLLGPRVIDGPSDVTRQRNESADGIWLTAQHDGYAKRFDLIHERRLFLRSGGDDLRGEDRLIPTQKRRWKSSSRQLDVSVPFAARFHLHPDVKSSISRDGDRVLLILPNGDGWQFRASRASLALEDSIYVGNADGSVRRSRQVVIQGIAHRREGAVIKWALQRLTGKKPPDSNQPSDVA